MSPNRTGPRLQVQLTRVLRLWKQVQDAPRLPHVDDLAEDLRVHRRTVMRDLAALRGAGWPVPPSNPPFGGRHAD